MNNWEFRRPWIYDRKLRKKIPQLRGVSSYPILAEIGPAGQRDPAGSSIVVTKPAGVQHGNLMIASIHVDGGVLTGTITEAWTPIADVGDSEGGGHLYTYYRFFDSGLDAASTTWTISGSHIATGRICRITGSYAADAIDISATSGPTAGLSQASPGVTTTTNNTLIMRFLGLDRADDAITVPGGHTSVWNFGSTTSTGSSQALATTNAGAAGSTGTANFGLAISDASALITIGIASEAGAATVTGVGNSSGTSTAQASGNAIIAAVGNSTGTSTATGLSNTIIAAVGNATGTSTAQALSNTIIAAIGNATGTSTAQAVGTGVKPSVGNAIGTSTADGFSNTIRSAVGNATGTSNVNGVSAGGASGIGSSSGTSTVQAFGLSSAKSVGNATGLSTVEGIGLASDAAFATAAGIANVQGVGVSTAKAVGNASGTSQALGVSVAVIPGRGAAIGTSSVNGVGTAIYPAVGNAHGHSLALAFEPGSFPGIAIAFGTSSAIGIAAATAFSVGNANGTSKAIAISASKIPGDSSGSNSTCPVVDHFNGIMGANLAGHISDTGQSWASIQGEILLDGEGHVFNEGGDLAFYVLSKTSDYIDIKTFEQEYVNSLTVLKLSDQGRIGSLVADPDLGRFMWGYYDGFEDAWGIASILGDSVTILVTKLAHLPIGSETALTFWTSGQHAMLAADGKIVLATVMPFPIAFGQTGVAADGTSSGTEGVIASVCLACFPRVVNRDGFVGGGQDDIGRSIALTISAWGFVGPYSSFVSIEPEPFPHAGMPMSVLRSGDSQVDPSLMAGLGRTYDCETYSFGITMAGSIYRDHPAHDTIGLFQASIGLTVDGRSVFDVLHMTFPRSPTGDYLTPQPLEMSGATSKPRVYRNNRNWRAMDTAGRVPLAEPLSPLD